MPMDHAKLGTELTTDPRGYGYGPFVTVGADSEILRLLLTIRDGTNPPANPTAAGGQANGAIVFNKGFLTPDEIANAIVYSEYTGGGTNNNLNRQYIDMLMTLPKISVEDNANPRVGLLAIFAAGTQTRANLIAAAQRFGHRAEEVLGRDTVPTTGDVARALGRF